jgi:hypothetical protein
MFFDNNNNTRTMLSNVIYLYNFSISQFLLFIVLTFYQPRFDILASSRRGTRYRGAPVEKIRVSVKMYNKKPLNWEAIPVYRLE